MFDHTDAGTVYRYSQLLHGGNNSQIGLAKSISVMPGDTIKAEVYAKYQNLTTTNSNLTGFALALTGAFGLNSTMTGDPGMAYDALDTYGAVIAGGYDHSDDINAPKAYINILLFDKDYNLVDAAYKQIGLNDIQNGTSVKAPHGYLSREKIVTVPGYAYIFLSNENPKQVDIYFDDLKITHAKSPVIQMDDYYPFGLTFNSYRRENSAENKIKFQGQEHIDDLNLGWDSFKWRNHQPDIGRFFNVDPLADKYVYNSPYAFSENHVTTHIELEGLEKVYIFDQESNPSNKRVYTAEVYVEHNYGKVLGPYRGSSYPNHPDSQSDHNTVDEGAHLYNNKSGHDGGSKKGLNIVDENGSRQNTPGDDVNGNDVTMEWVNVHSGVKPGADGLHNRGSAGCPTIDPSDVADFFSNFNWSNGTKGNSEGTVTIYRGESSDSKNQKANIKYKQSAEFKEALNPTVKGDNAQVESQRRPLGKPTVTRNTIVELNKLLN